MIALWVLSLAMLAGGTTSLVVLGVGPEIIREFGVSSGEAGWLMTLFAGTFAVAAPTLQYLVSERLPRWALVVAGLLLLALGLFWASQVETFASLLVARCRAALGGALIAPTSAALALFLCAALANAFARAERATDAVELNQPWSASASSRTVVAKSTCTCSTFRGKDKVKLAP